MLEPTVCYEAFVHLDSKWGCFAIVSTPTDLEESVLEERRQYAVHVQRDWGQGFQSCAKRSTSLCIQTKPETLWTENKCILKAQLNIGKTLPGLFLNLNLPVSVNL